MLQIIRIYFRILLINSFKSGFNLILRSFYEIRLHQYAFIDTREIQSDTIYSGNSHENLYSHIVRGFIDRKIIKYHFFFKIQSPLLSDLYIYFRIKKIGSFIFPFLQLLSRYQYYAIPLIDHL
jgi:hypothetical protein